jgi:hypothetical protein
MKDVKISPTAQVAALATIGAGVAAAVAANLPEIQRYLKVKRM